ncbi:MAG: hypothetical protein EOP04_24510, partial [Proteobacteria bacterium]
MLSIVLCLALAAQIAFGAPAVPALTGIAEAVGVMGGIAGGVSFISSVFRNNGGGTPPSLHQQHHMQYNTALVEENERLKDEMAKHGPGSREYIELENKAKENEKREAELKEAQRKRTEEELLRLKKLGMNHVNNMNFAFTGEGGVGKSSMINSMRGLKEDDERAAPTSTGVIGTTT